MFGEDDLLYLYVWPLFPQPVQCSFLSTNCSSFSHCPGQGDFWCLLSCIVSFPLLSNSHGNTWHFYSLSRVGCDVVEKGDRATQIFSIAGRSCPGVLRGLYSGRETGNPPQWVTPLSSAHSFLHSCVQYSVVSSAVLSSLPSGMFPLWFSFPFILVYSHFALYFVFFLKVKVSIFVSSHH